MRYRAAARLQPQQDLTETVSFAAAPAIPDAPSTAVNSPLLCRNDHEVLAPSREPTCLRFRDKCKHPRQDPVSASKPNLWSQHLVLASLGLLLASLGCSWWRYTSSWSDCHTKLLRSP